MSPTWHKAIKLEAKSDFFFLPFLLVKSYKTFPVRIKIQ